MVTTTKAITFRLPVMPLEAARVLLGVADWQMGRLVEDGRLAWVFDLRSKGAGRALPRVACRCVAAYLDGLPQPAQFSEIFFDIAPLPLPTLRASTVYQRLVIGNEQVYRLVEDGLLERVGRPARRGPDGAAQITVASLRRFLESRRMC